MDYLHPRKFGAFGHVASWTLKATSVLVLVGVYQFNTNDIGMSYCVFMLSLVYIHVLGSLPRPDGAHCKGVARLESFGSGYDVRSRF